MCLCKNYRPCKRTQLVPIGLKPSFGILAQVHHARHMSAESGLVRLCEFNKALKRNTQVAPKKETTKAP